MEVLVVSLADIFKINYQRPHHLLMHLIKNHNITLISTNAWWLKTKNDALIDKLKNNIELHYFSDNRRSPIIQEFLYDRNKLHPIISRDYDCLINFNSLNAGRVLSKRFNKRGITTIFDMCDDLPEILSESEFIYNFIKKPALNLFTKMTNDTISNSERVVFSSKYLLDKYGCQNSSKYSLLPNGVNLDLMNNCNKKINEILTLGFVGHLGKWVDMHTIFYGIKRLLELNIQVKLIIIGSGPQYGYYKSLCKNMDLAEFIHFTGEVDYFQVNDYLKQIDVGIIPFKLSETSKAALPMKLFEYLAHKIPVISTNIDSVRDAMGDHVLYYDNENDFINHVIKIQNIELRRQMGLCGYKITCDNYDWKTLVKQFEQIISR